MYTRIDAVFSERDIQSLVSLPGVLAAKERLVISGRGTEYFSVEVSPSIQTIILEKLGLDITSVSSIPMRWIRGDTPSHADTGVRDFEHTYLVYLTSSEGAFILDGYSYPITEGTGYVFSEGLRHETVGTGTEPRLLLGPMSEEGFAVGAGSSINGIGGTTIYIRQDGSDIQYSPDQSNWNVISWPCTVENTNIAHGNLSIHFITDITVQSSLIYFICGSEFIQFGSRSLNNDGTRPIVTIDGIANYPGFIRNGTSGSSGANYIYIFNLTIASINGSTLATESGWVAQSYFSKGVTFNYIINCKSDGEISIDGGGIVGSYAGSHSGSLTVRDCSSSGIIGMGSGGIIGSYSGFNEGSITCQSCYTTGILTTLGGGILGKYAASTNGTASVLNCYSTGTIQTSTGGICGYFCGDNGGSCSIDSCYTTGDIYNGGGIVGGSTNGTNIINCYTTGNLSSSGGLITMDSGPIVLNCYTTGTVPGSTGYIIGGSATIPTNCYSEANNFSSGWNTINATPILTGSPNPIIGNTWVSTGINQPFELLEMGYTPYTLRIIAIQYNIAVILRNNDSSVTAGSSTPAAIVPGKSYTLLQISDVDPSSYETITIDSTTGVISTTSATAPGSYIVYLRNTGSYNITSYTLTVTEAGIVISAGAEEQTSCCEKELHLSNTIDYTIRNHFKEGNTLIGSTAIRRGPTFYGALYNKKMAYSAKW